MQNYKSMNMNIKIGKTAMVINKVSINNYKVEILNQQNLLVLFSSVLNRRVQEDKGKNQKRMRNNNQ